MSLDQSSDTAGRSALLGDITPLCGMAWEDRAVRITEFTGWMKDQLDALDHDEIVGVDNIMHPDDQHKRHNLLRVRHANGATSVVMAQTVEGPGIPHHQPYEIPREAF
jgi:hypothetical protein